MPLAPPKHKEVRIDAVVNQTVSQNKFSDLSSLPTKDLIYNSKMAEQRITIAQKKRDQAEHLLEQAKE